mmetsp:Transcript_13129/g.35736  ORF Transcript_13129/g.35736 Transcript_13129/m.35736 type:complete len:416 (+) Transcript_13129:1-1248(+)
MICSPIKKIAIGTAAPVMLQHGRWGKPAKTQGYSRSGSIRINGVKTRATWSSIDHFDGVKGLLPSDTAAIFSSIVAISSVLVNAYGSQILERKRAENVKALEAERLEFEARAELTGVLARYRGPLLEATIDFEQKLYHIISGQDAEAEGMPEEELVYTLFTIAQFLGYVEVLRREGPRETSFLGAGNPQGTDTLTCLIEGFRFFLSATPARLQEWLDSGRDGEERDHPGSRRRSEKGFNGVSHSFQGPEAQAPIEVKQAETATEYVPLLRLSRGAQRAIGSMMIITPPGASRQYTLPYYDFVNRIETDPTMSRWFESLRHDLRALEKCGDSCNNVLWTGDETHVNCWTRILLIQHLCIDTIDILDPTYNRLPAARRVRFTSVKYAPVPSLENYMRQLSILYGRGFSLDEGAEHKS